jgi:hypothetical protein
MEGPGSWIAPRPSRSPIRPPPVAATDEAPALAMGATASGGWPVVASWKGTGAGGQRLVAERAAYPPTGGRGDGKRAVPVPTPRALTMGHIERRAS